MVKNKPTLILYHPLMAVEGYPVLAGRVQPAFDYLQETGTLDSDQVKFEEAPEINEELLLQVHTPRHISQVKGSGYDPASLVSAGAAVRAGEAVWLGEAANAFAFTGCAGHHASRDSFWGFCYYNNSALLVRHLQQLYGVKRFFIVDTDPHPGDGTRDTLGEDEGVYHLNFEASFRESMDTVTPRHVDVPFPSSSSDDSFVDAVRRLVLPWTRRIRPDMILWNMGHDAHALDYGGFNLSLRAFPVMTDILLQAAEEVCSGRLVVLLSGGSEVSVAKHAISGIVRKLARLPQLPADVDDEPTSESVETKRIGREIVTRILTELGLEES
jgi:acetoin utilization deacetylase AcuC-like enzyme